MGKNIFSKNRHRFTVLGKYRNVLYLRTGNTTKKININVHKLGSKKEIDVTSSAIIKFFINNQQVEDKTTKKYLTLQDVKDKSAK